MKKVLKIPRGIGTLILTTLVGLVLFKFDSPILKQILKELTCFFGFILLCSLFVFILVSPFLPNTPKEKAIYSYSSFAKTIKEIEYYKKQPNNRYKIIPERAYIYINKCKQEVFTYNANISAELRNEYPHLPEQLNDDECNL